MLTLRASWLKVYIQGSDTLYQFIILWMSPILTFCFNEAEY